MRNCIKILLLLFVPVLVKAQQHYPDSLRQVLKTARTDSTRYSTLNGIGEYYVEINGDSALYYLDRALVVAKKNNRTINEAATLARKGYVLAFKGKYPESLECFQQAIKLAEGPENENIIWNVNMPWIKHSTAHKSRLTILAGIHLTFAFLMRATNDVDQEILQIKESKAFAQQASDNNFVEIANMNLGQVYLELNRLGPALALEQNAEQVSKQTGYKKYLAYVYAIMGNIYLKKHNDQLALRYLHKGVSTSIEQKTFSLTDNNYNLLTAYYLSKKQRDSSLYYARKRLEMVHSMNSTDFDAAYEDVYRSYQLTGNTDSAYKYQGLALAARDKKYQTTVKSLADFQKLSFKAQLRAQELEKEQAAAQTRVRTYMLLASIGVFMLLAAIFYRNNRQKQKANEVLESTLDYLKATQTQLIQSEKMASLGELTAGIAHEIQNPLNFVNNFSEVSKELMDELTEELDKGDTKEAKVISQDVIQNLEKIVHHGKRADAIVKGMLQHSQSGAGTKEPTDINALVDECMRLAYHGLRAKDKSFDTETVSHLKEKLPKVDLIPQDIGRAMLNLFNNAFYAVNQKSKIAGQDYKPEVSVSTSAENGQVIIKVKDNGIGIPDTIKGKVMQPFFTTKPTGEGTGLGLSLTYDMVVKGHGGSIQVNSIEGEGSEFIIRL